MICKGYERKVHGLVYLKVLFRHLPGGIEKLISFGQDWLSPGRDLNSKHIRYEAGLPTTNTTSIGYLRFHALNNYTSEAEQDAHRGTISLYNTRIGISNCDL